MHVTYLLTYRLSNPGAEAPPYTKKELEQLPNIINTLAGTEILRPEETNLRSYCYFSLTDAGMEQICADATLKDEIQWALGHPHDAYLKYAQIEYGGSNAGWTDADGNQWTAKFKQADQRTPSADRSCY